MFHYLMHIVLFILLSTAGYTHAASFKEKCSSVFSSINEQKNKTKDKAKDIGSKAIENAKVKLPKMSDVKSVVSKMPKMSDVKSVVSKMPKAPSFKVFKKIAKDPKIKDEVEAKARKEMEAEKKEVNTPVVPVSQSTENKKVYLTNYVGQNGYKKLALEYTNGDMKKAFDRTMEKEEEKRLKLLGWRVFEGSVDEFNDLKSRIKKGSLLSSVSKIKGQDKYVIISETFYGGDMRKTFVNVQSVLNYDLFQMSSKLGWSLFDGSVSEFKEHEKDMISKLATKEPSGIIDPPENTSNFYQPLIPALNRAKDIGSKTVSTGSKVLSKGVSSVKNVKVPKMPDVKSTISKASEMSSVKSAVSKASGMMSKMPKSLSFKAFKGVSKDPKIKAEVEAKAKEKMEAEKKEVNTQVVPVSQSTENDNIHLSDYTGYEGQDGYKKFAIEYTNGDMKKAFDRTEEKRLKLLGWRVFEGNIYEFRGLRSYSLLGSVSKIAGQDKYVAIAEEFYDGDMRKTFVNFQSVLDYDLSQMISKLEWSFFSGSVSDWRGSASGLKENEKNMASKLATKEPSEIATTKKTPAKKTPAKKKAVAKEKVAAQKKKDLEKKAKEREANKEHHERLRHQNDNFQDSMNKIQAKRVAEAKAEAKKKAAAKKTPAKKKAVAKTPAKKKAAAKKTPAKKKAVAKTPAKKKAVAKTPATKKAPVKKAAAKKTPAKKAVAAKKSS